MDDQASGKKYTLFALPRTIAVLLIRFYQIFLSPIKKALLGANAGCRFHPTCSEYARQAFLEYGFWRGGYLALRRLFRCHPFHPGGLDPLPSKGETHHF